MVAIKKDETVREKVEGRLYTTRSAAEERNRKVLMVSKHLSYYNNHKGNGNSGVEYFQKWGIPHTEGTRAASCQMKR